MSRDFIGSAQGRSFLKSPNRDRITAGGGFKLYRSVILTSNRFGACDYQFGRPSGNNDPISATRYGRVRMTTEWTDHIVQGYGSTGSGVRIDELTNDGFQIYWNATVVRADAPYTASLPVNPFSGDFGILQALSKTMFRISAFAFTVTIELLDPEVGFADRLLSEAFEAFNTSDVKEFSSTTDQFSDPFGGAQYYEHKTRTQWAMGPGLPIIDGNGVRSGYTFNQSPSLRKIGIGVGNSAGGQQFGTGDPNSALSFFFPASASKACEPRQVTSGRQPPDAFLANTGKFGQFGIGFNLWEVILQRVQVYTTRSNKWTFSQPLIYEQQQPSLSRTEVDCRLLANIPNGSLEPPEAGMITQYGITYFSKCYPPFPNYQGLDNPTCFTVPPSS